MTLKQSLVVADIGGTNLRIAQVLDRALTSVESRPCRDFSSPGEALGQYFASHDLHHVSLCLAIASPSSGDHVAMTNLDWSFSKQSLQQELGLEQLFVINDYHAMSLSIPLLSAADLMTVGGGQINSGKPAVVCGPGTGLGVGILAPTATEWLVIPGEGGHVDFAPNTAYELDIWTFLHQKYGHVSAERVLSGPGLSELFNIICRLDGHPPEALSPEQITRRARQDPNDPCHKALQQFCAIFGSFCGSLALASGAFGGVYITGGMIPRFLDFFMASEFRERFEAKGRYRGYNARISTLVVTAECPGLIGAAAYLRQQASLMTGGFGLSRQERAI